MRAVLLALAGLAIAATAAHAEAIGGTAAPIVVCPTVTGTLSALGNSVTTTCIAANYSVTVTTPSGGTALSGTFTSTDPATSSPHRLWKNGVGDLGTSTEVVTGSQGQLDYRTVGDTVGGETIKLTAYAGGSAVVSITGFSNPGLVFVGSAVHTSDEEAVRAGKGFTVSTGSQSVTVGQYLNLYIANPSANSARVMYTLRNVSCDNPSGQVAAKWYGLPNPTVGLPTTALVIGNRKTGGATSAVTAFLSNGTTLPDTSPTTPMASRSGGLIPTGGMAGGPGSVVRTLEPGQSTVLTVLSTANGLGTAPVCTIDYYWYEEATN